MLNETKVTNVNWILEILTTICFNSINSDTISNDVSYWFYNVLKHVRYSCFGYIFRYLS